VGTPARLTFRRAGEPDVDVLADLGARAFVAAFGPRNDPQQMDAYVAPAFSPQRLLEDLRAPESVVLLAYDAEARTGEPVGYAHLTGGSAPAEVVADRPIELVRIYIEPALTGRGYGAELLQECIAQAMRMGGDALWLGVWEHNTDAQRFYERWSFSRVGQQPFTLGTEVQTDIVMARPLARTTPDSR
jgi:diamine N-acetyltransferase